MKLRLRIATSMTDPFDWEFVGYQFRAGRDPDCQLSFVGDDCRAVSWQHAKFVLYSDGLLISDLGSSNGTFVNGTQIKQELKLRVGDVVLLGQSGPMLSVAAYFDEAAAAVHARPAALVAAGTSAPAHAAPSLAAAPGSASLSSTPAAIAGPSPAGELLRRWTPTSLGILGVAVLVGLLAYVWRGEDDDTAGDDHKKPVAKIEAAPSGTAAAPPTATPAAAPTTVTTTVPVAAVATSTPVAMPTPVPPPPAAPPLPPPLSLDELVRLNERAVVWIGVMKPDESGKATRHALFTGWAAGPNLVVTTAQVVRDLETLRKDNQWPLFVACERGSGPDLPVGAMMPHPYYQPTADDDAWVHFNLGVVRVEGSLPMFCRPGIEPDIRATIDLDRGRVAAIGWSIPEDSKLRPASNADRPFVRENAQLTGPHPAREQIRFPRRELRDVQLPEGLSGSPVFGLRGAVIGTLFQLKGRNYVIPSPALVDLLR